MKVVIGLFHIQYTPTQEQVVDIMTKALEGSRFSELRTKLLVYKNHEPMGEC